MSEQEKEKKGKSGIIIGIIIFILVLIIGFGALVKLNVGGLGSNIVGPRVKDIPAFQFILPKEEVAEDNNVEDLSQNYNFQSVDEAIERLRVTEKLLKEKEIEAEKLNEDLNLLTAEVNRLKIFEENQVQFEEDKKEFDQLVADQVGSETFMEYVELVYPEQALEIYESMATQTQYDEKVKEVANLYQNMKAENAATILEETTKSNITMVSEILMNLDAGQAGDILSAMDPTIADRISRYMYPEN